MTTLAYKDFTLKARTGNPTNAPYAYLNYLVLNESYVAVDGGAWLVPESAGFHSGEESLPCYETANRVKFDSPINITQPGYIYVWVSNESEASKVWFDDLTVTHRKNIVSQATDCGTWGDVFREQKYNEDDKYRYAYQGQYAEKDEETGWEHFELREYDPVIGRWMVPDPRGQFYSPYVGMGNNPVSGVDPDGGECKTCPNGKQYDQYHNAKHDFTFDHGSGIVFNGSGSGPTVTPNWGSRFTGPLSKGSFWSSGVDNSHFYKTQWSKDFDKFAGGGIGIVSVLISGPVIAQIAASLIALRPGIKTVAAESQLMSLEGSSYLYTQSELYATLVARRIAYSGFTVLLGISKPGSLGIKAATECHWFYRKGNIDTLPILEFGAQFGPKKIFHAGISDGYYEPKIVYSFVKPK